MKKIREPNVAGSFYSDDPAALQTQLEGYLNRIHDIDPATLQSKGFIAPHAGFMYSGSTAAYVYKIIEQLQPETIIILAPSHYAYFNGISIDQYDAYRTPLGVIDVNMTMARQIAAQASFFTYNQAAHGQEHSLEVQLPFIQITSPGSTIVPVIVGNVSNEEITETAAILANILRNQEKAVIIASSDLSHFHNYGKAVEMDQRAIEDISGLEIRKLIEDYTAKKIEMCGFVPAIITIFALESLGYTHVLPLHYANSGDITGDHNSVVGYGALCFSKIDVEASLLSTDEKKYLLRLARNTIRNQLDIPQEDLPVINSNLLTQKRGAFVTLHKKGRLRGCIGYIQPIKALEASIREMAIAAAFQDPRFSPVERHEEPELEIEISVLSPVEEVDDLQKITVGTHGLIVSQGRYSGLLLPQVAVEWNWGREEFLEQTCLKAGLPPDAWKKSARVYWFTAAVFNEYQLLP